MSVRNIGIVYRKELREALRDRRTVIASVVIPLFLFPLLSVGFGVLSSALFGGCGVFSIASVGSRYAIEIQPVSFATGST